MNDVTTTKTGFRVSDVTLKNPRRQSEVAREIAAERGQDVSGTSVIAPVSLTPESVKTFYERQIEASVNDNEKKVYTQTILWIDELFNLRKKVVELEAKIPKEEDHDDSGSDIES